MKINIMYYADPDNVEGSLNDAIDICKRYNYGMYYVHPNGVICVVDKNTTEQQVLDYCTNSSNDKNDLIAKEILEASSQEAFGEIKRRTREKYERQDRINDGVILALRCVTQEQFAFSLCSLAEDVSCLDMDVPWELLFNKSVILKCNILKDNSKPCVCKQDHLDLFFTTIAPNFNPGAQVKFIHPLVADRFKTDWISAFGEDLNESKEERIKPKSYIVSTAGNLSTNFKEGIR